MARVKPYSSADSLARIDSRTREGKLVVSVRRELTEHVGGAPSIAQKAMIDRAAWMTLHIALIDQRTAAGKAMTEHDSRHYLAWVNTLRRTLVDLGLKATPSRASHPGTLAGYLATRGAA